jgi:hypothetical protein
VENLLFGEQGYRRQLGRRICNAPEPPNLKEKLNFLEKEHLNLFNGR